MFGNKKRQKQINDLYKALDIATDCVDLLNKKVNTLSSKVLKLQQESAVYKYALKTAFKLDDSIYNFPPETETKIN